jgi:membrane dipeptidase
VFATLFATPLRWSTDVWDRIVYADAQQAARLYASQLDLYRRLADEHPDHFRLILQETDLEDLLRIWGQPPVLAGQGEEAQHGNPVGLLILMEGAEGVREPGEVEQWWERGVRIIGPAWAGNPYCGGTKEPGPLTPLGYELLERMGEFGFGLDLSHMDEKAALQALDFYPGQVLATHSNAGSLLAGVETNRHLSNQVIQALMERDGVIGVHLFNEFLKPGWKRGDLRSEVTLERAGEQIDFICQLAGDASHVGIGSDFDGGFGLQSIPAEIDTIADLQKFEPLLLGRGYSLQDCEAILGMNWFRMAGRILPKSL